ncbi:carboxymuconolactone decarboxylase family protein [Bosea sp. (in: a-proteobacteria)]|jgi:alkylhydroperoxidase/carboxymuconolactone decarboxylase family protein YurZ|uniref:carboxymuconolactone decarboxylase family protein n=1 Tax=Bosea sp. (in: a-proteobacteria) TaxID=1871050 RepID=UPI003F72C962
MSASTAMSDSAALSERLSAVRAKRGYLLPHHGLMAISAPALLDAYDAAYTAIALTDRTLSHHDREFVWLAILIATDEAIATHHIAKFRAAGGSDAEVEVILTLTALALGFEAYRFVDRHWLPHLPACQPKASYLAALRLVAQDVPMRLVHMAAAATHACKANWDALALQIVAAYEDGAAELDLAEALSLAMFPGSVPHFVEAARVWRELIAAGKVEASEPFRTWAAMSGQGGFDEAAAAQKR